MFPPIDFNKTKSIFRKSLSLVPLIVLAFSAAVFADTGGPDAPSPFQAQYDEIFNVMSDKFYDRSRIENELPALFEKYRQRASSAGSENEFSEVVNAMLQELHVSHTYYLTPGDVEYYWLGELFSRFLPDVKKVFNDQEVKYPSIGIITDEIENRTFVMSVFPGGPADRAGMLAGDEIVAVNGERYSPVDSLRNHVGSELKLTVKHAENEKTTVTVTPVLVNPAEEMLNAQRNSVRIIESRGKKIGYIHIYSYAGKQYHEQLVDSVAWGELRGGDALIIDLRYGLGGADTSYLDIFNRNVPVITCRDNDGNVTTIDSKWRKPAVYLVNSATRSGKELLAYGAKMFNLATVVGERTAGAVMGGQIQALANGNLLYVACRVSLSDEKELEGRGVEPDVVVPMDVRYSRGNDIQIDEAVKYLVSELDK